MTCPLPHALRPPVEADMNVVIHSWVQELRHSGLSRSVPDVVYFPEQRQLVMSLVRASQTVVACNPEDSNHVFGYACGIRGADMPGSSVGGSVLHWLYVKSVYRKVGLGALLLEALLGPIAERDAAYWTQPSKFAGLRPDVLARWKLVPNPYVLHRQPSYPEAA